VRPVATELSTGPPFVPRFTATDRSRDFCVGVGFLAPMSAGLTWLLRGPEPSAQTNRTHSQREVPANDRPLGLRLCRRRFMKHECVAGNAC
jgi:hypothetical protein